MGDAKRFLIEDLCVYVLLFGFAVTWDFWLNLLHSVGLRGDIHPYEFGAIQGVLLLCALMQIIRKAVALRYYA